MDEGSDDTVNEGENAPAVLLSGVHMTWPMASVVLNVHDNNDER